MADLALRGARITRAGERHSPLPLGPVGRGKMVTENGTGPSFDVLVVGCLMLRLESLSHGTPIAHAPAGREDDWQKCEPAQIA